MDRSCFTPELLDKMVRILESGADVEIKIIKGVLIVKKVSRKTEYTAPTNG